MTVSGVGPTGSSSLPSLGTSDGGPTIQSSHNVVLGVAKTLGRQEIKGGYVYRELSNFQQPLGSSGAFNFNGQFTSKNGSSPSAIYTGSSSTVGNGGNALADLLLGQPGGTCSGCPGPESVSQVKNNGGFNQLIDYNALFVQDDFRATSNFTVNVGLRYEYELGQKEKNNQYVVGFDPTISYVFPCNAAVAGTACAQAHGGLVYAGQNHYPDRCCGFTHAKFSPRIGLAYEPRKGTVVRTGFGLFYAPVATVTDTTGYSQTTYAAPATPTVASPVGAAAPLSNPFGGPQNILAPSGNTLGALTGIGGTVTVQASNRKYPLVEQYSMNVEQEMPLGIVLELGYVGAHSMDFPQNLSLNQVPDSTLAALRSGTQSLNTSTPVPNPYYAPTVTNGTTTYPTSGAVSKTTVPAAQLLLPYPQFAGNGITSIESIGFSHYNALTIKVQKRYHGLTVLSTYTWSSNWDNFYGAASAFSSSLNSTSGPQDNYNTKGEYARAVNNIPNRMTAAVTYELPIGRGRTLFSNMPRILDYVLGGYEINTVSILQNGSPLSITQTDLSTSQSGINNSTLGFGGSTQRPTLIGNPCLSGAPESPLRQQRVAEVFQYGRLRSHAGLHLQHHAAQPALPGAGLCEHRLVGEQDFRHPRALQGSVPGRGVECNQHTRVCQPWAVLYDDPGQSCLCTSGTFELQHYRRYPGNAGFQPHHPDGRPVHFLTTFNFTDSSSAP